MESLQHTHAHPKKIVVGITGASGAMYGIRLLEILKSCGIESHLIISRSARITVSTETAYKITEIEELATKTYSNEDIGAACASGSFQNMGMIVAPCSIKSMSEIATGVTSTLISRSADVTLKERRRLVLLLRETPLHLGHIQTMASVTQAGAIIYPPVPAFYTKPTSIDDIIDHTIGRVLDLFGVESGTVKRWVGTKRPKASD